MKFLVLMNGWSGQGISGGDKHVLDMANKWKENNSILFSLPRMGFSFLKDNFPKEMEKIDWRLVGEIFLRKPVGTFSLILVYLQRTLFSSFKVFTYPMPDVVISSSHFFYDVFPAFLLKFFKKSQWTVYIYHLVSEQKRKISFHNFISILFEEAGLIFVRLKADLIFTDNKFTADELIAHGFKPGKIVKTPLGILEPPLSNSGRKKYDLCFSGRLVKQKGIFDLMDILSELKKSGHDLKLAVIGEGSLKSELAEKIKKFGLEDNVSLLGFVSTKGKYDVLLNSKIFVFPSYEEGWGISLAEALSCGLPSVVYDLEAFHDAFGEAPLYVSKGHWQMMMPVILGLIKDEDYYQKCSEASIRSVENYTIDKVAADELTHITGN